MKTESTTIGEYRYEVTQLLAEDGLPIFCTLVNLCMASSFDSLFGLISGAFRSKDLYPAVKQFSDSFKKHTQVVNTKSGTSVPLDTVFSTHFAGNYGDMCKWLIFCFKLNLGESFLAELQAAVLKGKAPDSSSPESPESTGQPGK